MNSLQNCGVIALVLSPAKLWPLKILPRETEPIDNSPLCIKDIARMSAKDLILTADWHGENNWKLNRLNDST
ncbi:hypothetical protein T4D_6434 [Trichinella pseudospiralis]|uniref:Uncharacterized protein n=1 Tax=Trichinella pseudospiralis TaxID=6337 RepID=A0A0V1FCC5_TRIPS|nr:hypothetical protein T4D_6434 [Trichinella pseudospiralis]